MKENKRPYFPNDEQFMHDAALVRGGRRACSPEHTERKQCYKCKHDVYIRPRTIQTARAYGKLLYYICEVCSERFDNQDFFDMVERHSH